MSLFMLPTCLLKQKPLCSSPKEIMFGRTSVFYSLVFILAAGFAHLVKFAPVYNFQNVQQSSMMKDFSSPFLPVWGFH